MNEVENVLKEKPILVSILQLYRELTEESKAEFWKQFNQYKKQKGARAN